MSSDVISFFMKKSGHVLQKEDLWSPYFTLNSATHMRLVHI